MNDVHEYIDQMRMIYLIIICYFDAILDRVRLVIYWSDLSVINHSNSGRDDSDTELIFHNDPYCK